MDWINVKDRLPERIEDTSAKVIVRLLGGSMDIAWYDYRHKGWYDATAYFPNVTHWMPLPDAPEVER